MISSCPIPFAIGSICIVLALIWGYGGCTTEVFPPESLDPDVMAALQSCARQTEQVRRYSDEYIEIPYPGGDVPGNIGSCTDVVVRALRAAGTDLQVLVHEDMSGSPIAYGDFSSQLVPNPSIDHRRVRNLWTFFDRHAGRRTLRRVPSKYDPGDIVVWRVPGRGLHIGIVSNRRRPFGRRPLAFHHSSGRVRLEDMLFDYPVVGHYRYSGGPGSG